MSEPIWVNPDAVRHIHSLQLGQFGGIIGIRDAGMLQSALSRPINLWHYERTGVFDLAAAYAFGIAMNHPFLDGNKRTAFVVSVLFIELNGYRFLAEEVESATTFISLAASLINEKELSLWFEGCSSPRL